MIPAPRLTVLGSLNMDISVTVPRLPGPGETALGGAAAYAPGGKGANQAVAAARLGGAVRMAGCLGDDGFGRQLRAALRDEGVDDDDVRTVADTPTGLAMITVDESGENMITVAPGANREVGAREVAAARLADVLVISAEIPVAAIRAALSANGQTAGSPDDGRPTSEARMSDSVVFDRACPGGYGGPGVSPGKHCGLTPKGSSPRKILRILNLAPAPPRAGELLAAGPDWLVVSESEAASVLGDRVSGLDAAGVAAKRLARLGPRNVVVTAGAAGAAYAGTGVPEPAAIPGFTVTAVDSVGAGDTFVGALAVALASGCAPAGAIRAACAAGATAASRPGTQAGMPSRAGIETVTGFAWPL